MTILRAEMNDAEELLKLQILSYQSEGERYGDYTIPPLTQTLDGMREDLESQVVLKAVAEGSIIGSVRAYEQDGSCKIGKLFVHPARQGKGTGTALLKEIEREFASCSRYELFAGEKSADNIRLYTSLGYRPFRKETLAEHITLIFMEKERP
ncbi:GNAT family N-acetyltransferase [Paenibacillus sp. HN-1]|uniref:GNAT family N-acetyltransferase n=1 Tax=Paenibacillus TaxID=44249 RepID=UPI001CA84213|nr:MULTISPECIES: GNAT family N-acetyltransferase [Paenibacillus]MBY9081415.1 GNAT family N-acetyltransferase [Paenibacillus sp. CGMCC 1.18879]MBY9084935.1 GNAT family N-acetyltransferase [Paenibacillus sinensis]